MQEIRGRGEGGESRRTFLSDNTARSVNANLIAAVIVIVCSFIGTFFASSMTNNAQYAREVKRQSVKDAQSTAAEAINLLFDSKTKLHDLDNSAQTEDKPWHEFGEREWWQYMIYFRGWRHDMILSYFRIRQYFGKDAADIMVHLDEELKPKQDLQQDKTGGICGSRANLDLLQVAEKIECQIRMYSATVNNPDFTYFDNGGHPIENSQELVERIDMKNSTAEAIAKNFDAYDLGILKFVRVINSRLQTIEGGAGIPGYEFKIKD
jgi:hypothetical protein